MATVKINYKGGETPEQKMAMIEFAIRKFNKEVEKDGILKELYDRRYFVSKGEQKRQRQKIARRKQLKQLYKDRELDKKFE